MFVLLATIFTTNLNAYKAFVTNNTRDQVLITVKFTDNKKFDATLNPGETREFYAKNKWFLSIEAWIWEKQKYSLVSFSPGDKKFEIIPDNSNPALAISIRNLL